jgi:hypothetical protein
MLNNRNLILIMLLASMVAAPIPIPGSESNHGSAKVFAIDTFFIDGKEIESREYDVKWESSGSEAVVVFKANRKTVVKIQGKIVDADNISEYHRVVTGMDSSGRRILKALQFSGKKFRIVFE